MAEVEGVADTEGGKIKVSFKFFHFSFFDNALRVDKIFACMTATEASNPHYIPLLAHALCHAPSRLCMFVLCAALLFV